MRLYHLAVTLSVLTACSGRGAGSRKPSAARDSLSPSPRSAAVQTRRASNAGGSFTAVFQDEIPIPARTSTRGNPPPQNLDRVSASLNAQLQQRGAIQWNASRPLRWGDFQAPPQGPGREGALSSTGQISGSACSGNQFQYGAIAAFIPGESWVRPEMVANQVQSAVALAHEQVHFDISEIMARQLRRTFMTLEHPCSMTDAERDALGAASFNEEATVQQRYDDETTHGLNMDAQLRWQAWAVSTLAALAEYATPVGSRQD